MLNECAKELDATMSIILIYISTHIMLLHSIDFNPVAICEANRTVV